MATLGAAAADLASAGVGTVRATFSAIGNDPGAGVLSAASANNLPFGADLLFEADCGDGFVLGVEVCEDVWMPVPPSSLQAIAGATVLANLSASNETIGKFAYRRQLVAGQSGRCVAGYVYASSGPGESTTDLVFGGHCLIAENGSVLAESPRFRRGRWSWPGLP